MSTAWSPVMAVAGLLPVADAAAWSLVMDAAYRRCRFTEDTALQKIQRREEKDPDQIHEMPEEPRVLDPVGEPYRIRLPELGAGTPEIRVHRHPAQHVEPVQSGQGVVDGEEVVGAGKGALVEMGAVFEVFDDQEGEPKQDRPTHVEPKGPEAAAHQ